VGACGWCGGCGTGTVCDTVTGSPTQYTCVAKPGGATKAKDGAACGPSATCLPPGADATSAQKQNYAQCLDDQCESGLCYWGACTRTCTVAKDSAVNFSGAATPTGDGLEDPGASPSCQGFADGPLGSQFVCAQITDPAQGKPVSYCIAGTTFAPCTSNSDCSGGEVCTYRTVRGAYRQVCAPAQKQADGKAGKVGGAYCNSDPAQGPVVACKNGLCLPWGGCVDFCTSNAQCSAGGVPMVCQSGVAVLGSQAPAYSACVPQHCALDSDCKNPDFFCLSVYNGVKHQAGDPDPAQPGKLLLPGWETSICAPKAPGTAARGEACDAWPSSGDSTQKPCETKYWCINGSCGGHCQTGKDCAADQVCAVQEFAFDTSQPADSEPDVFTALHVCAPLPKAAGPCLSPKQCTDPVASYCRAVEVDLPASPTKTANFTVMAQCIAPDSSLAALGEKCGAAVGKGCQSGICLGVSTDASGKPTAGWCTDVCGTSNDCPASAPIAVAGGKTFPWACSSIALADNATEQPYDNLYLPVCLPQPAGSSLADCGGTLACAPSESCQPFAIALGPDAAAKVEYRCVKAWVSPVAQKKAGDLCNPSAGPTEPAECASRLCLPDAQTGKGYCSALCKTGADCGTLDKMQCDTGHQMIPRQSPSMPAIAPLCQKHKSCIPCRWDYQCPDTMKCTWLSPGDPGGRCAPPCAQSSDCAATDGGPACQPAVDRYGKPTGASVCTPTCP
ncbi:MAG: hypothetical protein HY902_20960, partial [Deltaproteobacteria bacterium]|nr:hypothetical protein [Deltaproteobacteria bacterium]